jgi:hypothetical protein
VAPSRASLTYWIATSLVVFIAVSGGIVDAMQSASALEVFRHLGYPDYFATLLGVAKVVGGLALVTPVPRVLREWAYAGLSFDVIAAAISAAAVGDPIAGAGVVAPILVLALTLISYVMWRRRSPVTKG